MKILAIDSCSNVATGAVVSDGVVVSEFVINNKKTLRKTASRNRKYACRCRLNL